MENSYSFFISYFSFAVYSGRESIYNSYLKNIWRFSLVKKRVFFVFTIYIWFTTLYGLIFHPYFSMLSIRRRPVLFPIMFTPAIGLLVLFIMGRIAKLLIIVYGLKRDVIAIFLSTTLLSVLLWQLLLIYFLVIFLKTRQQK